MSIPIYYVVGLVILWMLQLIVHPKQKSAPAPRRSARSRSSAACSSCYRPGRIGRSPLPYGESARGRPAAWSQSGLFQPAFATWASSGK